MFFFGLATALSGYLTGLTAEAPDLSALETYSPPAVTRVYAGDGDMVAEYAEERRIRVSAEAIPDHVKKAFLAAEDGRYRQHSGVDYRRLAFAIGSNLAALGTGGPMIGGSTITQQVVKNTLLNSERTVDRKITEALLAWRLERALDKEAILEIYLNEIYFGLGAHGIAAAAEVYFDKTVDRLTLPEAAYLAALPKAPNNYHPERHPDRAAERRNWVIGRMVANGFITAAEAEAAVAAPLEARGEKATGLAGGYFAAEVRRRLNDIFGENRARRGGFTVRTSLDPDLQALAQQALRRGLETYDRAHGWRGPVDKIEEIGDDWPAKLAAFAAPSDLPEWRAAAVLEKSSRSATLGFASADPGAATETGVLIRKDVRWARRLKVGDVIYVERAAGDESDPPAYKLRQIPEVGGALVALDPHTGRVRALVGGYSFGDSPFNRATQALRQPGSSFKPFVYAAALETGYYTPSSIVLDSPIAIKDGTRIWRPKNYSGNFLGPTTLRVGVERSRNVMTVRLAQEMGMDLVADYVSRFDIYDGVRPVPSLALGAGETTLLRLAAAYATFPNGGYHVAPKLIDRVQDDEGRTLYRSDARRCYGCENRAEPTLAAPGPRILRRTTAYQMVSILEGVVQRGTARVVRSLDKPVGGKTGTTNDARDVWFIGFTPDLVAGVFIGHDRPRTLGGRATGGGLAAPIFLDFMQMALADVDVRPFSVPTDVELAWVYRKSGRPARKGARGAILEAFQPGTGPGGVLVAVDDVRPQTSPKPAPAVARSPLRRTSRSQQPAVSQPVMPQPVLAQPVMPQPEASAGPVVSKASPSGTSNYSYEPGSNVGTYTINGKTFTYERN